MPKITWKDIKHFKPSEFDSPDAPGSGEKMDLMFVARLDAMRDMITRPIKVNSGYRTPKHNKAVGGVPGSAHTKGVGADIACTTSEMRWLIVNAAIDCGIKRIGIGPTIVHVDADPNLPSPRIWLY